MAPRKNRKQNQSGWLALMLCAILAAPIWAQTRTQGQKNAPTKTQSKPATQQSTAKPRSQSRSTQAKRFAPVRRVTPQRQSTASRSGTNSPSTRSTQRTVVRTRSNVRNTTTRQQRVVKPVKPSSPVSQRGPVRVDASRSTTSSRNRSQTPVQSPQTNGQRRESTRIINVNPRNITSPRGHSSITVDRRRIVKQPQVQSSTRRTTLHDRLSQGNARRSQSPQRAPRILTSPRRSVLTKPNQGPVDSPSEIKRRLRERTRPPEIHVNPDYRRRQQLAFPWRRHVSNGVAYWDRPQVKHGHHYVYSYRDWQNGWHQSIVTPRYSIGLRYHWGRHYYRRHHYPFYHRKYVFVSLGGYWPIGNLALRYYWYGWHPYEWYGYNPVAYELEGATNNYYTYNYYDTDSSGQAVVVQSSSDEVLDNAAAPEPQGPADVHFEIAVKAFEQGDYGLAQGHFEQAMIQDQGDVVLPFAYAQTLFAQGDYSQACDALRQVYARSDWDHSSVYYPRGLYENDEDLFEQIGQLLDLVESRPNNTDLQLMLGYQLLGVGELESAMEPLLEARQDPRNVETVDALLVVLVRIQEEAEE